MLAAEGNVRGDVPSDLIRIGVLTGPTRADHISDMTENHDAILTQLPARLKEARARARAVVGSGCQAVGRVTFDGQPD